MQPGAASSPYVAPQRSIAPHDPATPKPDAPTSLADERDRRRTKNLRALGRNIRLAYIGATPAERLGLQALADDVKNDTLTVAEAQHWVARCRDEQRDRNQRAA